MTTPAIRTPRVGRLGLLWPALTTLAALALLIILGNWQMTRKAWKEDLIAKIAARGAMAPLTAAELSGLSCPPPEAPDPDLACQFYPVRLTGSFDHAHERHVFGTIGSKQGGTGVAGYFVMTPVRARGLSDEIVVNRGFVAEVGKSPDSRAAGQVAGEMTIVGILRRAQARGWFDAADDTQRNIYFVRDPVELGLVPAAPSDGMPKPPLAPLSRACFYLDLSSPDPPGGLPHPSPGPPALTNRHLEYALTWYGLAAALASVFGAYAISRVKSVSSA
jgi:surfeit locus 1 family protein